MFKIDKRVIFADTDAGGIVYHSKYLDFCEEARMEFLLKNNLNQSQLLKKYNLMFIVKSCNINYIKPAKLEDLLKITIDNIVVDKLTIIFNHSIYRNNDILVKCNVNILAINKDFKIIRKIPDEILNIFIEK